MRTHDLRVPPSSGVGYWIERATARRLVVRCWARVRRGDVLVLHEGRYRVAALRHEPDGGVLVAVSRLGAHQKSTAPA